jgi:hypothetical protein
MQAASAPLAAPVLPIAEDGPAGLPDHDSDHEMAVTSVKGYRDRTWHGGHMRRNTLIQTIAAVIVGAVLFLTAAGSCGGGEGDDGDDAPGVTQQDGDGDDGEDD